MNQVKLPATDSISHMAEFWDTHDLTDFQEDLEEVSEPVFVRDADLRVHLEPREAQAVQQIALAQGISIQELIRTWILQKVSVEAPSDQAPLGSRNGRTSAETT